MADDLYFVKCGDYIKIGRSCNPKSRLEAMRTGNPHEMEMVKELPGRGYEEKAWHLAFAESRTTGEWFEITDQLERAIAHADEGARWTDQLHAPADFFWENYEMYLDCGEDPGDAEIETHIDWQIKIMMLAVGLKNQTLTEYRAEGIDDDTRVVRLVENYVLAGGGLSTVEE